MITKNDIKIIDSYLSDTGEDVNVELRVGEKEFGITCQFDVDSSYNLTRSMSCQNQSGDDIGQVFEYLESTGQNDYFDLYDHIVALVNEAAQSCIPELVTTGIVSDDE